MRRWRDAAEPSERLAVGPASLSSALPPAEGHGGLVLIAKLSASVSSIVSDGLRLGSRQCARASSIESDGLRLDLQQCALRALEAVPCETGAAAVAGSAQSGSGNEVG